MNDNNEISKPEQTTYFIARDKIGNIVDNGSVGVKQVWTSKWQDVKRFTNKQEWLDELKENGVTPIEEIL
jgi:hypothetical protein